MGVVFFCESCGSRFDVDPNLSGKRGRCKKCGQTFQVPKSTELASMVAMPALAAAAPARAASKKGEDEGPRAVGPGGWLAAVTSSVGLAPLTVERMTAAGRPITKRTELEDLGDSKPYKLADFQPAPARMPRNSHAASGATIFWRQQVNGILKVLRKANEFAYLVSVPFVMMVLLGVVFRSRSLALAGATVVVLLNIGRLVVGLINLAGVPFKEGPMKGLLFLVPPFTFIYLANHWNKVRKPAMRVVGPLVTVGIVLLLFTFVPWLSSEDAREGNALERIRAEAASLKRDMRGEVDQVRNVDVGNLKAQAQKQLGELSKGVPSPGGGPGAGGDGPSPLGSLIEDVKGRVREKTAP